LQRSLDFLHRLAGLRALLAMDKHRSRQLCKPTKYRPTFHFGLCDKYARRERRQDKNVEITQMITDEQAARRNIAVELCFDPKNSEHTAG